MSKLSSIFGLSSDNDSTDALKYAAPKEPKPIKNKDAIATPASKSTNENSVTTTPGSRGPATAKISISASVRLFKLNPSVGNYDPCENGMPLGFVIVGSRSQYQFLIYNAQKQPQCVVPITTSFQFNIRELYMSISDPQGNGWSILFDSYEVLSTIVHHVTAVLSYLWGQSDANAPSTGYFKEILPISISSSNNDEDTVLSSGMTAGIYYSAWELPDDSDYVTDIITQTPLISMQPPEEVAKVKLGSRTEELFPGFNDLLIGARKGSKVLIAVSPRLAYSGTLDLTHRQFPSTWLILEVEIVKVKSDKSEKKKDKKKTDAPVPGTKETADGSSNPPDLTTRMAYLSQQGSGGAAAAALAMALGKSSPLLQTRRDSENRQGSFSLPPEEPPSRSPVVAEQVTAPSQQQPLAPVVQAQAPIIQTAPQKPPVTEPNPAPLSYQNQSPQMRQNPPQQETMPTQPPQGYQYSYPLNAPYGHPQEIRSDMHGYALTIVPGQESRSYYANSGPTASYQPPPQYQAPVTPQPNPSIYSTSMDSSSTHQILTSLQHLHMKIDQINSSIAIGGALPRSTMSLNHPGAVNNPIKLKAEDLMNLVQSMSDEYDRMKNENNTNTSNVTINKLQEKIELLQTRNEKLINEKGMLLEKHQDLIQSGVDSSSKYFHLQQELETMKREKLVLQQKIESLEHSLTQSTVHSRDADLEKQRLHQLEQENTSLRSTLLISEKDKALHDKKSDELNALNHQLKSQVSELTNRVAVLTNDLRESNNRVESKEQSTIKVNELTSELDSLRSEFSKVTNILNNEQMKNEKLEFQHNALKEELEQSNDQIRDLLREVQDKDNEISDLQSKSKTNPDKGLNEETVKGFMQEVYSKAMEVFSGDDNEAYEASEVVKRIRSILKAVANEFMNQG